MKKITSLLLSAILACLAVTVFADGVQRDTAGLIGMVIIANHDSVRVRAAANAESEQIGLVNPGEQYDCVSVASNGWFEIVYPDGQTGFVSNKLAVLLKGQYFDSSFSYPVGTVEITHSADVRTRNGGGEDYAFMGSVQPGNSFPCVGVSKSGWPAILLDNGWVVYVSNDLVTLHADVDTVRNPVSQSSILHKLTIKGIVVVTNDKAVNIRAGDSTDYPALMQAQPGDIFLLGTGEHSSSWCGIILPESGEMGYIAASMVEQVKVK